MSEAVLTPAKRHKDWTPDQPWPEDVPRRVKSILTGLNVIFYKSQRVRPNGTFSLTKPQDYDPRSMAPLHTDNPTPPATELEAAMAQHAEHPKQVAKRSVAQGAPSKSSAHLTMKAGATPKLDDEQEYEELVPAAKKKNPNDVI